MTNIKDTPKSATVSTGNQRVGECTVNTPASMTAAADNRHCTTVDGLDISDAAILFSRHHPYPSCVNKVSLILARHKQDLERHRNKVSAPLVTAVSEAGHNEPLGLPRACAAGYVVQRRTIFWVFLSFEFRHNIDMREQLLASDD